MHALILAATDAACQQTTSADVWLVVAMLGGFSLFALVLGLIFS